MKEESKITKALKEIGVDDANDMDPLKLSELIDNRITMPKRDISVLEKFCLIPSGPGFEKQVQDKLISRYTNLDLKSSKGPEQKYPCHFSDDRGNLYAKFPGNKNLPSIGYLAHADSPAFMITSINPEGFISARPMGWAIDRRLAQGSSVVIGAKDNTTIPGAFTTKHTHIMYEGEEEDTELEKDIILDCGGINKEILAKEGVDIGSPVYFRPRFDMLLDEEMCQGTNLDDRAGTMVLYNMAKHLINNPKGRGDVYLISTVSEEMEPQGSQLAAKKMAPYLDAAIAIDTTASIDYIAGGDPANPKEFDLEIELSKGPVMKRAGFNESIMSNVLKKIAKNNDIKIQIESDHKPTYTDEIWFKNEGMPTSALYVPTRNLHSAVETIDTCDLEKTIRIATESAYALADDKKFLGHIKSIFR